MSDNLKKDVLSVAARRKGGVKNMVDPKDVYPVGDPRRYDEDVAKVMDAIAGTNTVLNNINSCLSKREIINKLPVAITPCLVKVHGIPIEPTIDGYVLAIAANKRVCFPNPYNGEWYPEGKDVTDYVTDIKLP